MPRKPRLGRPPDADSNITRERILEVARQLFASRGYEATSNRLIAEEAGLTTGAIYHYFDRKLDIYTAVFVETQAFVYDRFEHAAAQATTFVERLRAVLEESHALNNEDPSIARFLGSSRVDSARDPEISAEMQSIVGTRQRDFFDGLIQFGIRTGEIDPSLRDVVSAVLRTVTVGLTDAVSEDRARHRRAVDGIMMLVEGSLIREAAAAPAAAAGA